MTEKKSFINYKDEKIDDYLRIDHLTGVIDGNFYRKKKITKVINKYFDTPFSLFNIKKSSGAFYMLLEDLNRTQLHFFFDIRIDTVNNELLGQFLEEMSCIPNFIDYKLSKYQVEVIFNRYKLEKVSSFETLSTLCDELENVIIIE